MSSSLESIDRTFSEAMESIRRLREEKSRLEAKLARGLKKTSAPADTLQLDRLRSENRKLRSERTSMKKKIRSIIREIDRFQKA